MTATRRTPILLREEFRAYFIAFMKNHGLFNEEFEENVISNLPKSGIGRLDEGSIEHPWVWVVSPDEYLDAYIACFPLFQQHEIDCLGCTIEIRIDRQARLRRNDSQARRPE